MIKVQKRDFFTCNYLNSIFCPLFGLLSPGRSYRPKVFTNLLVRAPQKVWYPTWPYFEKLIFPLYNVGYKNFKPFVECLKIKILGWKFQVLFFRPKWDEGGAGVFLNKTWILDNPNVSDSSSYKLIRSECSNVKKYSELWHPQWAFFIFLI